MYITNILQIDNILYNDTHLLYKKMVTLMNNFSNKFLTKSNINQYNYIKKIYYPK